MTFDNYTVRLLEQNDTEAFFKTVTANKARLEAFFPVTIENTTTLESTAVFINEMLIKSRVKLNYPFVVIDKQTNNIIGYIHVKNIDWDIPKAELGFFTDEEYAGKGILHQAMTLVIDHFFNELGFEKLYLRTHELNTSARKLAEKCGFVMEGQLRKDHRTTAGELVDLYYYGLLKN